MHLSLVSRIPSLTFICSNTVQGTTRGLALHIRWSDLRFSKLDTVLPIRYIVMSLIQNSQQICQREQLSYVRLSFHFFLTTKTFKMNICWGKIENAFLLLQRTIAIQKIKKSKILYFFPAPKILILILTIEKYLFFLSSFIFFYSKKIKEYVPPSCGL